MHTLTKRLEIIKHCIALDDKESLVLQTTRLQAVADEGILYMLRLLHLGQHAGALTRIEKTPRLGAAIFREMVEPDCCTLCPTTHKPNQHLS